MLHSIVFIWRRGRALRGAGSRLFLMVALAFCSGCHHLSASAGMELQAEDYRAARKGFQTRLLQHGPAPQNGDVLHAPVGARQVEYDSKLHLQAWITPAPPTGRAKKPAVLFLHGGFAIGADDWEMAQPYRDAGYVTMLPVLRGENGQHGDYSMFYNETNDVLAAKEYLAKLPYVDAKHIYLAGHSVGGTLTLLAAMAGSGFRAAASFSGAPDAIAWSRGQPEVIPFDCVQPARVPDALAPRLCNGSFKCPMRIFYGSSESLFADASQQTAERAKKKGLDAEAVSVRGDHFSAVPEEIKQSIEFFQSK